MTVWFRFGVLSLWSLTALAAGCAAAPAPMHVSDEPATGTQAVVSGANVGFPQYPSISPDGRIIVFAWGGDLWSSPIEGGNATRLTVHPADERRSAFSPDGTMLAFESDRDGARNLYVMPISRSASGAVVGGTARRVTVSDRAQVLSGFTPDGKALVFMSFLEPAIYKTPRMYRVELAGEAGAGVGGRVTRLTDGYGSMPRFTPDGSGVVFQRGYSPLDRPVYRGSGNYDLWKLSFADGSGAGGGGGGGGFTRLTFDAANDFDGWPLADGSVVFVSSRDGQNNVYRMRAGGESGGAPVPLTNFKPTEGQKTIGHGVRDLAVSADGRTAVFAVWDRLYRLDLSDAKASPIEIGVVGAGDEVTLDIQRISVEKEISEAALSPDGKTLAVIARGEVFVRAMTEGYPTRRVTTSAGRERDLAWSPDGRVLYFASDDPGLTQAGAGTPSSADNLGKYAIYGATVSLAREDITPEKPKPKEDAEKKDEKKDEGEKKDDAAKADKPADAKPDDAAKPDAKTAAKPKDKKPDFGKRWAESLRFAIEPVVVLEDDARRPVPSPDGRLLAYTRGVGDVVLLNLETNGARELFKGWEEAEVIWAGDSRNIIYTAQDLDFNSDIWLMDTGVWGKEESKPSAPVNLTRHPDLDGSPRLSADGKVLTFLSERGGQDDQFDVYQVFLDKELEGMTAYEREDYFKKAAEAAGKRKPIETPAFVLKKLKSAAAPAPLPGDPKADAEKKDEGKPEAKKPAPEPMVFDTEDAYLRIRRITSTPQPEGNLAVTPGADRIVFTGPTDTDTSLLSIDFKAGDKKVLQAGPVGEVSMSLTGDRVMFVKGGLAFSAPPKGGKVDAWPIDAPVIIDVAAQQRQKFLELARTFGDRFYHPTMKGLDWPALTRRYLVLAESTRTSAEFNRVAEMLFGEVDGSHTGAMGGPGYTTASPGTGYLGVSVKPVAGGYEITHITAESPAANKTARLRIGDVLVSVEGRRFAPDDASVPTIDLDAAMAGRAGRETLIEVRRSAAPEASAPVPAKTDAPASEGVAAAQGEKPVVAAPKPFVVLVPLNGGAWSGLRYQEEVRERRAMVDKLSDGKLGYLHIRAMGESEVREFERDLFAAASGKEGLIIDVRDNGGGSTADILLASLTAPRHAWTVPRGADPKTVPTDSYPRDRRLIYGYTRPITVLINEHSFSNAEIFAHAIKTTGRGRLVGTQTFGGVISTGAFTLIDGTNIRMPFRGWYLPDGTDMENHGAKPDVDVPQTPTDEAAGRDAQLEAAVKDMQAHIKN